ncbi:MAG: sel1 repeat family protein [Candidatus Paracaedibacteraceae bacterium]|nr:sel1 repeat family protein [Candidatus Paracaedibacteraceae bacterium]
MTKLFWKRALIFTSITLVSINPVGAISSDNFLETFQSPSPSFPDQNNVQKGEDCSILPSLKPSTILAEAMQAFMSGDAQKRDIIIDEVWRNWDAPQPIDSYFLHQLFPNFKEIKTFKKLSTQELGIIALLGNQEEMPLTSLFLDEIMERSHSYDGFANYILGCMYLQEIGVKRDTCEALSLFQQSAEQGCIYPQCILGLMYLGGIGIEKNEKIAFDCFKKSAPHTQSPYAQYLLGLMYWEGIGIKKEKESGVYWLIRSAEQGHSKAREKLNEVLKLETFDFAASFASSYYTQQKIIAVKQELENLKTFYRFEGEQKDIYNSLKQSPQFIQARRAIVSDMWNSFFLIIRMRLI